MLDERDGGLALTESELERRFVRLLKRAYRQDGRDAALPSVVVELPSGSDNVLDFSNKVRRWQRLGVVVYAAHNVMLLERHCCSLRPQRCGLRSRRLTNQARLNSSTCGTCRGS